MTKKTTHETNAAQSGKTELTENQLEKISGGPHIVTLDGLAYDFQGIGQKTRLPVGSGRFKPSATPQDR